MFETIAEAITQHDMLLDKTWCVFCSLQLCTLNPPTAR